MVKESEEFIRWGIEQEWKVEDKTWEIPSDVQMELDELIKRQLKNREWAFANPWVSTEDEKRWYGKNRKKVYLINAKMRGKSTFDRLGDIDY